MLSSQWALFEIKLTIFFSISSVVKLVARNMLSVTFMGLLRSLLQLYHKERCFEKQELKKSAFPKISVISRDKLIYQNQHIHISNINIYIYI